MTAGAKALQPLGPHAVHIVVDMQRVFAEPTAWHVPSLPTIIDPIVALTRRHSAHTIFTRFMTPRHLADATGSWRRYYERWPMVLQDSMDAALLDLVGPLAGFVPPAEVCDKTTFSSMQSAALVASLDRRRADTLVLTGAETDVCVLATALEAVDRGYRTIVAADAVTSLSTAGHHATLDAVFARLDQQIEIASVDDVLAAWPKE